MRKLLLIFGLVSLLGGCGGGGTDPIEIPKLSIDPFLGTWSNIAPNPVCAFDAHSNSYLKEGPAVLATNYYSESYLYFSDANCTNLTGASKSTFSIEWSAPTSSQTKNGAIRARIFHPFYTVAGNLLDPTPTDNPSVAYKALFSVTGNRLQSYFNLDAADYPLGNSAADYEYEKTAPTN
jgi:hypothetical protein